MASVSPVVDYRITDHAREEIARRQITEEDVAKVLTAPEQMEIVRTGRKVYQSRIRLGEPPKIYLLRVFVDSDRFPPEVVTVYRTSKVVKY
jgi:hypothetical protein